MFYSIAGLMPVSGMGTSGFMVKLFPGFREMVAAYDLDQERVNNAIKSMGREWLDACGFDATYDPEESIESRLGIKKKEKPGPNARPLYMPNEAIRVSWGEWGPEHITVPGNACGLDLDRGICAPRNGRALVPHNVDSPRQAMLLLIVFCWFAEALTCNWELQQIEKETS